MYDQNADVCNGFSRNCSKSESLSNTTMRTCLFLHHQKPFCGKKADQACLFVRNIQSVFMHVQLQTQSLTSSSKSVGSQHNCNNVRTWHVDRVDPSGDSLRLVSSKASTCSVLCLFWKSGSAWRLRCCGKEEKHTEMKGVTTCGSIFNVEDLYLILLVREVSTHECHFRGHFVQPKTQPDLYLQKRNRKI